MLKSGKSALEKSPVATNAQKDASHDLIGKSAPPKKVDSKFFVSLGIGLAAQAAGIVWWASSLQSSVQHNDFQIQMMSRDVEKHSIFVRDWPAGKWGSGSLPDDVKQNLKIGMLELDVEKIMDKLYNGHSTGS